jgi:hypothetical protein
MDDAGFITPDTARAKAYTAAAFRSMSPRFPDGLWAAGDIFLSLIDNMQESFGLTPIEAMAAGMPRVISDWDGYRDSVKQGEDGFLIRTTQPPPGSGRALSELLLSGKEMYGGFLAKSALCVAVDHMQAAEDIVTLIKNKNLRRSIAEKAKTRVKATYDWKYIIPAYEALWDELAAKRRLVQAQNTPKSWNVALPQVPDPFTMYAGYPTAYLSEAHHLSVIASPEMIKKLWSHDINVFGIEMMIHPDQATQLINFVSTKGSAKIADILVQFASQNSDQLWRTIAWLAKLGILRVN